MMTHKQGVVYFDQRLVAAHCKRQSNYCLIVYYGPLNFCSFKIFCNEKLKKEEKATTLMQNLAKKCIFLNCTGMLVEGFIPLQKNTY